MRLLDNMHYDFMGKRKFFYGISGVLFLISLISFAIRGFEFGIEFKGGSEVSLQFDKPVDISKMRNLVSRIGLGEVEAKTFGGDTGVLLRTEVQELPRDLQKKIKSNIESQIAKNFPSYQKTTIEETQTGLTYQFASKGKCDSVYSTLSSLGYQVTLSSPSPENKELTVRIGVSEWIKESLKDKMQGNHFMVQKEDKVGPKVGFELKRNALLAVIMSLLVILVYLGFRFKFIFALGAVIALFHDAMITLGMLSLFHGLIPGFNMEISLNVIAAVLTLIGYSVTDTVVVFDRERENMKLHKGMSIRDNFDHAINTTMRRTIITSFTAFVTVFILLLFGGDVLRGFAFVLCFGIVIGTYSSIFVASALVYDYSLAYKKKIEF